MVAPNRDKIKTRSERRRAMTDQIELNVEELEEVVAPGFVLSD